MESHISLKSRVACHGQRRPWANQQAERHAACDSDDFRLGRSASYFDCATHVVCTVVVLVVGGSVWEHIGRVDALEICRFAGYGIVAVGYVVY